MEETNMEGKNMVLIDKFNNDLDEYYKNMIDDFEKLKEKR